MALQVSGKSSFDATSFQNTLQCPVMLTPLTDAVMLIPCGHTISEVAANSMYQGMSSTGNVSNPAPCPLCRTRVTACYPNQIVRSLAGQVLGTNPEEALMAVSAVIPADETKDLDLIPFPGQGARFVKTASNWRIFDDVNGGGQSLVRMLRFVSDTKGSLFQEMQVCGYRDGAVTLLIDYSDHRKVVSPYLESCGIILSENDLMLGSCHSKPHNIKLLFNIIVKHNEIPVDMFPLVRDLIASGDWRTVTPLKEGERLASAEPMSHRSFRDRVAVGSGGHVPVDVGRRDEFNLRSPARVGPESHVPVGGRR